MKVYRSLETFNRFGSAIVTSGSFDGVHLGHQKILQRIVRLAEEKNGESVVITFDPHPRKVLFPNETPLRLLTSINEKIELVQKLKIDHFLIIPFTREFSQLSSLDFIQKILINTVGARTLVIGYDHRFGKNREGSFEYLYSHSREYGFEVEEIPKQEIDHCAISSSIIREKLLTGEIKGASQLLGRNYTLQGVVVEGNKLGRTIGYPTANIQVEDRDKLVPSHGVYAVLVHLNNEVFRGMLNIGLRPTVGGKTETIEVNIFDFDKDIYGQKLIIEFIEFLRPEKKFEGLPQLKEQLFKDKEAAIALLQ